MGLAASVGGKECFGLKPCLRTENGDCWSQVIEGKRRSWEAEAGESWKEADRREEKDFCKFVNYC